MLVSMALAVITRRTKKQLKTIGKHTEQRLPAADLRHYDIGLHWHDIGLYWHYLGLYWHNLGS